MNLAKILRSPIRRRPSYPGETLEMESIVLCSDEVLLWHRSKEGSFKEVSSVMPRSPLDLRDLKISAEGRQILAVPSDPLQGVSFACFTRGQDQWLYYDFFPSDFIVACGIFSPIANHIVYLATTIGGIVEFDLKLKIHTVLTKGGERPGNVTAIDVNSTGTHLAVTIGGSILIHSLKNKVNFFVDYSNKSNSRVFIRFHPFKQFHLGAFSLTGGAAIVDLTSTGAHKSDQKYKIEKIPSPPAGDAHICDPTDLLWTGTETLLTIANDGRIVLYSKKRSQQCYRSDAIIYSATVGNSLSEILLGLENEVAIFDLKSKKIMGRKQLRTLKPVKLMARARSYVPISKFAVELERMYTQKQPQNPEPAAVKLSNSYNRSSDAHLISPVKGFGEGFERPTSANERRKSSIGSLISPPKSQANALQALKSVTLPPRRSAVASTIEEESMQDADWKENHTIMQSTALHDSYNGNVDFGLDSSSPVKRARQPFSLRNSGIESTPTGAPVEKKIFCHVDSGRSALQSKLESPTVSMAPFLEKQNALLSSIVESNQRIEDKLGDILVEIREQSLSSRRLIDHSIQLTKVFQSQNMSILTDIFENQRDAWLYAVEEAVDEELDQRKPI